jgi:leucyl aminopeptidase
MKSKPSEARRPLKRVVFAVSRRGELKYGEVGLARGLAIAHGIGLAKDLGNTPSNICTPEYLASEARKLAKTYASAAKSSPCRLRETGMAPSCRSARAATSRRASSC